MNNLKKLKTLGIVVLIVVLIYSGITVINLAPPITFIGSKAYYTYTEKFKIHSEKNTFSQNEIEKMKRFKRAESIDLFTMDISDISFLDGMKQLKDFKLSNLYTEVDDWSPLASCSNLEEITLWNVGIHDLSSFTSLKNLKYLELDEDLIADISDIKYFSSLEYLCLSSASDFKDISPIGECLKLRVLKIYSYVKNDVSDITAIGNLKELEELVIYEFLNIHDISPLQSCTKLKSLKIKGTSVTDFSFLINLPDFQELTVEKSSLSPEDERILKENGIKIEYW